MSVRYNWAGDSIIRDTIMWNKRAVLGYQNVYIPTDIREWISSPDSEVIKRGLKEMDLPVAREAGTFDLRAWTIWKFVAESVEYVTDKVAMGIPDFWLFPSETLTLRKGDCEDSSFLLASMMIAGGISEHCVRVVLGQVKTSNGAYGHAWVVYLNEAGVWCLLESTLNSVSPRLSPADPFAGEGVSNQYEPQFCLNGSHLWQISPMRMQVSDYVKIRDERPIWRPEDGFYAGRYSDFNR